MPPTTLKGRFKMEDPKITLEQFGKEIAPTFVENYQVAIDHRSVTGNKEDAPEVEIHGKVAGFVPAPDRILIKRLPPPPDGLIARPEILQEQAARGFVIAVGSSKSEQPPLGSVASFSKFAEEKHFDDEGSDQYALVWSVDVRGWHERQIMYIENFPEPVTGAKNV